jgi:hypothetical protein
LDQVVVEVLLVEGFVVVVVVADELSGCCALLVVAVECEPKYKLSIFLKNLTLNNLYARL